MRVRVLSKSAGPVSDNCTDLSAVGRQRMTIDMRAVDVKTRIRCYERCGTTEPASRRLRERFRAIGEQLGTAMSGDGQRWSRMSKDRGVQLEDGKHILYVNDYLISISFFIFRTPMSYSTDMIFSKKENMR